MSDENDDFLIPGPEELLSGLNETIDATVEPLRSIFEELHIDSIDDTDPSAGPEHTVEIIKTMEMAIKNGDFDHARELIEKGKGSTSCSWCHEKLDRLDVDVDYVEGVCRISPTDCNSGKLAVATKANHMYNTLEKALHIDDKMGEHDAN